MSIWTWSDPPLPRLSRLCYSDWFLNQLCTGRWKRKIEERRRGGQGQALEVGSLFIITAISSATFIRGFSICSVGIYHVECDVKDNSWHLMPTCPCFSIWCLFTGKTYTLHNCPTSAIRASLGRDELDRESCTSETFHFVILEFMVIDGGANHSPWTVSLLESKCLLQQEAQRGNVSKAYIVFLILTACDANDWVQLLSCY